MNQKLRFFIITLFAFAFISNLFEIYGTRTFTLIDDHTIITSYDEIQQGGYLNFLTSRLKDGERFRPMMALHHALGVALFGTVITAWKYFYLLLAAISFTCFYYFFRKRGYSYLEGICMTLLLFVGMQSVIWWIFDSTENIGLFYLSIALLAIESEKDKILFKILFGVCIIAASLSKESFIFILPFIAFFYREKRSIALFLIALFILELSFVLTSVGSTFGGYAGVESSSLTLSNVIKLLGQYLIRGYGIPLVLLVGWLFIEYRKDLKSFLFKNWDLIIYLILGVGPFFVLYLKSGLNVGRYLIPLLLPQVIVLVELLRQVQLEIYKKIALAVILLTFGYHIVKLWQIQRSFFIENKQLSSFFEEIETKTNINQPIAIFADPLQDYEKSGALMIYLRSKNSLNRQQSFLKSIRLNESEAITQQQTFFDDYYERFGTKEQVNKNPAFVITVSNKVQSQLEREGKFTKIISFGPYSLNRNREVVE